MKYGFFEILAMIIKGILMRPELVITFVVIMIVLCAGAYAELLREREKTNERCRKIKERYRRGDYEL